MGTLGSAKIVTHERRIGSHRLCDAVGHMGFGVTLGSSRGNSIFGCFGFLVSAFWLKFCAIFLVLRRHGEVEPLALVRVFNYQKKR